jgi:hypothetical protein
MVHAGKTESQIPHYVLYQQCMLYVAALCTPSVLQFLMPVKWNNKVKGYKKTKSYKPFWNAKYSTYIAVFTVNTTTQDMCNCQNKTKTYDNYIYRWAWHIVTATAFHSAYDFHKFIGEQTVFGILDQLKLCYIKKPHTHTHTNSWQNIYTLKRNTNQA